MPSPLFSTYRQGENRVSSSLLAVFERLGVDLVARVLGEALERPELRLVSYASQPGAGAAGVPDAEIRANFRFLFEVKTVSGAVVGAPARDQLERHLRRLDGGYRDELLILLTPDVRPPLLVEQLGEPRLLWMSFEALDEAIDGLLGDEDEPASEQQRFLLRELRVLFEQEGLLIGEDVAVVAAAHAYNVWRRYGAYICQANRTFRGVRHWGFYRNKRIEPEFPQVEAHWLSVSFDEETAASYAVGNDAERRLAQVICEALKDGESSEGDEQGVYLLQSHDDPGLIRRSEPLRHAQRGAWTQGQRYASLAKLMKAETTAEL